MKKRSGLICIAVLIVIVFIVCMSWLYQKKNTSIPTLGEVARMSDEEATRCLAGHTQKELYDAWGPPTMCLSGLPGDWWSLSGTGGIDGRKVTVYYAFEYYGEPGGISVISVMTPAVQESEDGETEIRTEEESSTGQQGGLRTERDTGVYSMRDEAIQETPLYASFLDNEVAAVDMKNQEERYWSDYYDKALDSSVQAFHMKAEDMNGDGEKELLIHLRQGDDQGEILVFHNEDGRLVEWESVAYGMHSPEINLYNNQTIEIVGHGWSRSFFRYNDKGRLERVFDCYSEEDTEEDGASYRTYMIQEYEDGVVTKEHSMTEFHGSNGENDREMSENQEKEAEFNRVLDDFLKQLGEGIRLNSLFLVGSGEYSDYDYILEGVRDEGTYGYYDVDGDGVDELVTWTVGGINVFQAQDNMIKEICRVPYSILLENGTIWYHRPGGAPMHDDYQWYRLEGEEYQIVDTFSRYDWDLDGCYAENGEGDVYFYNEEEISKDEWEELIQPFLNAKEAVLHNGGKIMREE